MDARTIEQLKQDIVFEAELAGHRFIFHTTWGLFSPRQIDSGTALLLRHLDVRPDERALDIGCGYGPLGLAIAAQAPQGQVHMVDKDFVAVDYARANARRNGLNNVEAYLSNGLSHVPADARFTTVVSNIPAKVGKELLTILLWDSWQHLEPGGQMVVVTINGLRQFMKRHMLEIFGNYDKVKQGRDYTVSRAVRE